MRFRFINDNLRLHTFIKFVDTLEDFKLQLIIANESFLIWAALYKFL